MQRGLPPLDLRPRPKHLLILVDLALLVGLFMSAGKWYLDTKGSELRAQQDAEKQVLEQGIAKAAAEAEAAVASKLVSLSAARADSLALVGELVAKREQLEIEIAQHAEGTDRTFRLSDSIYDLKVQAENAVRAASEYDRELASRDEEILDKSSKAQAAETKLVTAQTDLRTTTGALESAHREVAYEPRSILPETAGVMLRHEVRSGGDLTGLEFQQLVFNRPNVDLGFSLGVGLGSGDVESSKQAGLLLSRSLVHRRLGLDFGAGYSLLTNSSGDANNGAYATASLRFSPMYRERFHFGLGARADQEGVQPFVGVALGRR